MPVIVWTTEPPELTTICWLVAAGKTAGGRVHVTVADPVAAVPLVAVTFVMVGPPEPQGSMPVPLRRTSAASMLRSRVHSVADLLTDHVGAGLRHGDRPRVRAGAGRDGVVRLRPGEHRRSTAVPFAGVRISRTMRSRCGLIVPARPEA